jgi:hypothetical protein
METLARNIVLCSILTFSLIVVQAQTRAMYAGRPSIDSLKEVLATQIADTNKVMTLLRLSRFYRWNYPDSSLDYAHQALDLAETLNYEVGIFWVNMIPA